MPMITWMTQLQAHFIHVSIYGQASKTSRPTQIYKRQCTFITFQYDKVQFFLLTI